MTFFKAVQKWQVTEIRMTCFLFFYKCNVTEVTAEFLSQIFFSLVLNPFEFLTLTLSFKNLMCLQKNEERHSLSECMNQNTYQF